MFASTFCVSPEKTFLYSSAYRSPAIEKLCFSLERFRMVRTRFPSCSRRNAKIALGWLVLRICICPPYCPFQRALFSWLSVMRVLYMPANLCSFHSISSFSKNLSRRSRPASCPAYMRGIPWAVAASTMNASSPSPNCSNTVPSQEFLSWLSTKYIRYAVLG